MDVKLSFYVSVGKSSGSFCRGGESSQIWMSWAHDIWKAEQWRYSNSESPPSLSAPTHGP